jgi:hypothetical protein
MPSNAFSAEISEDQFRERRMKAGRSGNPAWLWPEVPVDEWVQATRHIAEAVSSMLNGATGAVPPSDPKTFSLACYTSGVGPLLGYWVEQGTLEAAKDVRDLLALHLEHARARARKVGAQSREIVSALIDDGVPVVVLKGAHTAHAYFPDPATRPASDLDLLVPPDFSAQAEVGLAKQGLGCAARSRGEASWRHPDSAQGPKSLWFVHADDPWSVDLRTSLNFTASPGATLARFESADPIETSDPWPLNPEAGVLSQPLLLLYLAAHAGGGLHSLTLLRMVEIVFVVRKDIESGRLAWDDFLHLGAVTNALGATYPALRMAEKLAPGTIPSTVLEICAEIAPPRARTIVDKLEPATAHRVDRASVAEHFMWVGGVSGWFRQLASDIAPGSEFWPIYQKRMYRLIRGRVSR